MTATRQSPGIGLVTTPQADAAYEGTRVLNDGGNAADALVTASLVQGVIDPHRCGIGGFGCCTLYFQDAGRSGAAGSSGTPGGLAIDFHGRVGRRARADQWKDLFECAAPDGFGYVLSDRRNDVGYQSITVPGMLSGIAEIHRRFGLLPWRDLVERAVPYAEDGFIVTPELAEFWIRRGLHGRVSTRDRLALTEEGRRICLRSDSTTYETGETFRQTELANTYRRIAAEGPESFYKGDLAREMAGDWEQNDALVTSKDLDSYHPEVHEPLQGGYRGLEVLTTPLPGGGVALLQALELIEARDVPRRDPGSPELIHEMASIFQAVWHDRLTHQGDPAFGCPPAAHFLTAVYLEEILQWGSETPPVGSEPGETTQLTVLDGWGNMVSLSHSLGYNSGVFTPGLGFLYNNCMSGFDPRPGKRNSIAPGKARSTAVAETILLKDGRPWIALGSPGGARITAALAQVIVNIVDFGMSVAEAVVSPRFDAYGPGTLLLESRFPPPVVRELERRGWQIVQSPKPFGVVGRVYAIETPSLPPTRAASGVDPGAPGASYRQETGRASGRKSW